MLGTREPETYGSLTLEQIKEFTEKSLTSDQVILEWYQSNIEGEIVTKIQEASKHSYKALIINPGAYSHTSVAIYDALQMIKGSFGLSKKFNKSFIFLSLCYLN